MTCLKSFLLSLYSDSEGQTMPPWTFSG